MSELCFLPLRCHHLLSPELKSLYLYLPQKKWGVILSFCRNKDNQQVITESSHRSVTDHSSLTDLKALHSKPSRYHLPIAKTEEGGLKKFHDFSWN